MSPSSPFRVRLARPEDALGLAEVHVASWRTTYPGLVPDEVLQALSVERRAGAWLQQLTTPDNPWFLLAAVDETGRIVGFANAGPLREGPPGYFGEVGGLYFIKEAQGQGGGRQLITAAMRLLAERGLASVVVWVLEGNLPARGFYEHLGGCLLTDKPIRIGSALLTEVSYGWPDVRLVPGV
jgi:GNAT superfamily N-acetyltransferase